MASIDLEEYATRRGLHPTRAVYAAVWEGLSLHVRGAGPPEVRQPIPAITAEKVAERDPKLIFLSRD